MFWLRSLALGALLLGLGAAMASGQTGDEASHPAIATWGTEQGLPSSIVLGVQQTPDGYLWLASYEGLVRFDGVTFRTFGVDDIPGLGRGSFAALATGRDGVLWAGSESGELVRFAGGQWSVLAARQGLPADPITVLAADLRKGGLWIGTRGGVWRLDGQRAVRLPAPPGMPPPGVTALAQDAAGTLWIGTVAEGLLRYRDGRYTRLTTADGLISDRIDALYADADGTVWVGAYGSPGVTRIRGSEIVAVAQGGTDAPRRVHGLLRDRRGTLWLAAENGLFVLDERAGREGQGIPVVLESGTTTKAEALFEDRQGSLWVGSRQSGLFQLRPTSVTMLGAEAGKAGELPHPFAFAVEGDGAGGVWIATQDGAVHRPSRRSAAGAIYVTKEGGVLAEHVVRDLLRDEAGDVWLATTGGLTRLPGGRADRAVTYTSRDGLADDRARTLAPGRGGRLWIGTFNGLSEWQEGRLRSYGPAEGLLDTYVLAVHEDRRGTLWVGTQTKGLLRRAPGGRFVRGPEALARGPVFRIIEDADGTLWIGTSRGLARLRPDGSFALIGTRQGLPGNTIFQAVDDRRGSLWLTGPWGIARVARAALEDVAEGRVAAVGATPFGRGEGMRAGEASSIGRSWLAPDGTLWFPTPAGVAIVDPARIPSGTAPPRTRIEEVLADGNAVSTSELAAGTRRVQFRFTAPVFLAARQLRFRYRLDGYDPDWVDAGTRRGATYTNLSPGEYRFRVQARAADGAWPADSSRDSEGAGAVATIRLRPYVWQTGWFLAAALLLGGGAVVAAYRLRVRAVARAAREELLRSMSLRDELTGLYNRRGLTTMAEQAVRAAQRDRRGLTLLLADLDGLKEVNDTSGHAAGDRMIVDTAALLLQTFRQIDVVARLGGDEFAVLLPETEAAEGAALEVRLASAITRHNAAVGRSDQLALSFGTSHYDPESARDDPQPLEALLEEADRQMYAMKRGRRAHPRTMAAVS